MNVAGVGIIVIGLDELELYKFFFTNLKYKQTKGAGNSPGDWSNVVLP